MDENQFEAMEDAFQKTLVACRQLYQSAARQAYQANPRSFSEGEERFAEKMDQLHQGLLIKIYVTVVEVDRRWSREEKQLGRILFNHVWPGRIPSGKLREAAQPIFRLAQSLVWSELLSPFRELPVLRDDVAKLETIVMRLANLIAKADGAVTPVEAECLRSIQAAVDQHVIRPPQDGKSQPAQQDSPFGQASIRWESELESATETETLPDEFLIQPQVIGEVSKPTAAERLEAALDQLQCLIGIEPIKQEIRTLINFLQLQRQRESLGLPRTELTLHMVFGGNPGTGKTTVARIVGDLLGAMGILQKGHLVETDRTGLVAEYAGQTAPKANRCIDTALDGVLFIDEAYSLVAESGDDPFGHEAVQILLKRMEDDRHRLVVILAGYPEEMDRLLSTNPGLKSRFSRQLQFDDYSPGELGQIFGRMCIANHYELTREARLQLLLGFHHLYQQRDAHFGNGRLVRNTFEGAIRRLANRIAGIAPLTRELLTTLQPDDLLVDPAFEIPASETLAAMRLRVPCPGCQETRTMPATLLCQTVKCPRCETRFTCEWGEPIVEQQA